MLSMKLYNVKRDNMKKIDIKFPPLQISYQLMVILNNANILQQLLTNDEYTK